MPFFFQFHFYPLWTILCAIHIHYSMTCMNVCVRWKCVFMMVFFYRFCLLSLCECVLMYQLLKAADPSILLPNTLVLHEWYKVGPNTLWLSYFQLSSLNFDFHTNRERWELKIKLLTFCAVNTTIWDLLICWTIIWIQITPRTLFLYIYHFTISIFSFSFIWFYQRFPTKLEFS